LEAGFLGEFDRGDGLRAVWMRPTLWSSASGEDWTPKERRLKPRVLAFGELKWRIRVDFEVIRGGEDSNSRTSPLSSSLHRGERTDH